MKQRRSSPPRGLLMTPVLGLCLALMALGPSLARADNFPLFPEIQQNVAFWKKIYSQYGLREGVVHDKDDLSIIYEVIDLLGRDRKQAARRNRRRIELVRGKYRAILERLAVGEGPVGREERRVFRLFGQSGRPEVFKKAAENIRVQLGQKERFRRGIIRSGGYLDGIRKIFREEGVPLELAMLAHVESSFNVKAYSRYGAAGIWQFTRATGKRFMVVNYTLDERRDPLISSRAAARLLKENYQKLGSWPLAITAYNHGAAGLARALEERCCYQNIFLEHRGRNFGFASRNFYSEFLAALEVAENYRRYFGELVLDRPRPVIETRLSGYVDARLLSELLDLDLGIIREYNPAIREPVYEGSKYIPAGYTLKLPGDSARIADLMAALPNDIFSRRQKPSLFYRVRRGDTMSRIARALGVSLGALLQANQLQNRGLIYAGQNLRVPPPPGTPVLLASAKQQVAAKKPPLEPLREEDVRRSEARPPVPDKINPRVVSGQLRVEGISNEQGVMVGRIRVEPGETLGHYAEWLEVRAGLLRRYNGLTFGQTLRYNQQLKVPFLKVSRKIFEERRFEYHKEIIEDFFEAYQVDEVLNYSVKRGDSLWLLCTMEFDLPLWLLIQYNPSLDFSGLKPAQQIRVPIVTRRELNLV